MWCAMATPPPGFSTPRMRTSRPPCLVLLDLNLPKKNGEAVLKHLRGSANCRHALVLIVTSSDAIHERKALALLGVSGYFHKPTEYAEFMKLGPVVEKLLAA